MRYVIVGGGIAGTTMAENISLFDDTADIILISPTNAVKRAVNIELKGDVIQQFDVINSCPDTSRYTFIHNTVTDINIQESLAILSDSTQIKYDKLCIATGATPNVIFPNIPFVYGIRDTESVQVLQEQLRDCKHITVVGNGGIATELTYLTDFCHISWVIKDDAISSVYVDNVASKFLLDAYQNKGKRPTETVVKRHLFTTSSNSVSTKCSGVYGSALGPDWYQGHTMRGSSSEKKLEIEYECECVNVEQESATSDYKLKVTLSSGKVLRTDALISATGVIPNSALVRGKLRLSDVDGGILVDKRMMSSVPDIYAAGDVCHIPWSESENWKQMRLWTQARQQGFYAARSMASVDEDVSPDISFDIFTHSTKFFGFKVILLGRYAEWEGCECYFRITENVEFIKLVISSSRVQGAVLIGDTDLEEVFENLILNQLDISHLGENILDPNVDIEDYFD